MDKIALAFRSRTVWTVVILVIINGLPSVRGMIPAQYIGVIDTLLGLAAAYFRVNPQATA